MLPPRLSASSDRELLRIRSFRKYQHDTLADKQIKGDCITPSVKGYVFAPPRFFIVTGLQLYNLLPSEIGTLMKNNSEEMLRVAGIEVCNDT